VGIGAAANASYKLQVTGATNLTGALSGTSATFSGNLTVDTNTLFVDSANNRVGIQTISPFSVLHVGSRPGNTNPSLNSILTVSNDGLTGIDLGANQNANNVIGHINWVNGLGVANHNTARIDAYADGATNSGSLRFWTASASSSPTIRLTIAASGAATFSSVLEVNSADLNNIFVTNPTTTGATTGSGIGFKAYNGTSVTQSAGIILTSSTWSFGTYSANQLSIGSDGTGGVALRTANSAPITFFTGGATAGVSTERMRITSGGIVQVGITTLPSGAIGTDNGCMFINNNLYIGNTNGTSGFAFRFDGFANGLYGLWSNASGVDQTGVVLNYGAGSWTSSSDERLKDINSNIENAIDKLKTLRTVNYSWKLDETKKENLGLIAQEVEKVFPQVVDILKDGYLGIRYTELIPVLIKAIQEQTQIIKDLEARIVSLESK
jgi:hypothetical protein